MHQKYNNGTNLFFAVIILALPVFFIGMRTEFNDTHVYVNNFNSITTSSEYLNYINGTKGIGFKFYQWVIKRYITDNAYNFLFITAIVHAGALLKLYYKHSVSFVYSICLFFFSMSFTFMMGGIRQFLAVSLVLYASDWIFEKKIIPFLIVVFLAYEIHVSAIIWLPLFFAVQGKPWNIKIIAVMILGVLAISMVDSFTDLLSDSLEGTDYEGYANQFAKDDGANIMHSLIAFVPVAIAFCKRKEIEEKNNKISFVLVNISVANFIINLVAHFTSGILVGRFPIFLEPFNLLLLPWMFENTFEEKDKFTVKLACLAGYLGYAYYYIFIHYSGGMPYYSATLHLSV